MTDARDTPSLEALLPCPFCGGKAALNRRDLDERHGYGREAWVQCDQCNNRTGSHFHDDARGYAVRQTADPKAIAAWNTRALSRPITEEARSDDVVERAKRGLRFQIKNLTTIANERGDRIKELEAALAASPEQPAKPGFRGLKATSPAHAAVLSDLARRIDDE